jgi:DNA-binding PadR family transcriptional regulator
MLQEASVSHPMSNVRLPNFNLETVRESHQPTRFCTLSPELIGQRDAFFATKENLLTSIAVLGNSSAMLSKELVAASTVPLVLSVLADGESYGYALIQRVRELSAGGIAWTEGMLYPVLHWMEDERLVESEWKEAETGRRRKYYRLRKEGRKALQVEKQQWMTVHTTLNKLWKTQPNLI